MSITDKTIQSYIANAKKTSSAKYKHFHVANNLYLRVSANKGFASWLFRIALPNSNYKYGYKFSYYTIGRYPLITLKMAKDRAEELNNQVRSGINPLEADKATKNKQLTLKEIWDKWLTNAAIKPATLSRMIGLYKTHLAKWGNLQLISLNKKMVLDIIQPLIDGGHYAQARTVMYKVKQLATFAFECALIEQPILLDLKFPSEHEKNINGARDRTLNNESEIKKFLCALDSAYNQNIINIVYHHVIKLILMLGTRKLELATIKWGNYDRKNKTLLLTETKNDDKLLIKLPPQAILLIEELSTNSTNDYIFYHHKTNSHICPRYILSYLNEINSIAKLEPFTVHDLRRTFSSRLTGLGFRQELIDKATNHRIQGTAKHYQHDAMLDERYEMLKKWADHLDKLQFKS